MDGEITVAFPTGHAYGIKTKDGKEILLHLGIDTVELEGKGFTPHVKVGDKVKAGDHIADMDLELIKRENKPLTSMLIFTSGESVDVKKIDEMVTIEETDIVEIK